MPRRTKHEAEKTRTRIIASALSLFAEKGYEKTSFEDIARKLKMTKGAVFWHFKDKQSLVMAVVREAHERFNSVAPGSDTAGFEGAVDILSRHAAEIVASPRMRNVFTILHSRIRWGAGSMTRIRAKIIDSVREGGPLAFMTGVLEREMRAGRLRKGVKLHDLATVMLMTWSAIVRAKIEGFLEDEVQKAVKSALLLFRDGWLVRSPAADHANEGAECK